jgi:large subunit ribosomal protein L15
MNLHDVTSVAPSRKKFPRVGRGRGSGWGKTSRRGQKGASSRAGWGGGIMREGGQMPLARRVPKKGFNNENFRVTYEVVNIESLAALKAGEITPESLKTIGLVKKSARWVKILGKGEITAKVLVAAHKFSTGAVAKIQAAGGTVRILPGPRGETAAMPKPARAKGEPRFLPKVVSPARKAAAAEAPAEEAKPAKAPKAPKAPKPDAPKGAGPAPKGAGPKGGSKPKGGGKS